ncbi:unnamed protein product [Caenorhabditis bovis]|uniref:Uncharacterized protein n=1 Tax=Caenorhabditis bovis TaxID=2654633 RepID=A0A8S1ECP4_9PELO|nr:unnamed protein product [Caenorhabditis bovis]
MQNVPHRYRYEPNPGLMIDKFRSSIKNDYDFACEMQKCSSFSTFKKILVPSEKYTSGLYKRGMPDMYTATLFSPKSAGREKDKIFYLYFSYNFIDEVTKIDYFDAKKSYIHVAKNRLRPDYTLDELSIALIWRNEYARRANILKNRPNYRQPQFDGFCRKIMPSSRHLFIKEEKTSTPIYGHLIRKYEKQIKDSLRNRFVSLDYDLKDDFTQLKNKALSFIVLNPSWIEQRRQFQPPLYLHVRPNYLRDFINNHQYNTEGFRTRRDLDLFNEFNYMTSSLAYTAHFCRAIKRNQLLGIDENMFLEKEGRTKGNRYVRVRPSRYDTKATPTAVVVLGKDGEWKTAMEQVPERAPSVASLSGYSTDSAASTATVTPLDWALNWKMQDNEFEHRYSKGGMMEQILPQSKLSVRSRVREIKTIQKLLGVQLNGELTLSMKTIARNRSRKRLAIFMLFLAAFTLFTMSIYITQMS